jgi:hypothetical protein
MTARDPSRVRSSAVIAWGCALPRLRFAAWGCALPRLRFAAWGCALPRLRFADRRYSGIAVVVRYHAWQTRVNHFTTTVRICAGFDASVQATTISSPERTIRGNTPEPSPAVPDTFIGAAAVPFAATSRIRTWAP